MTRRQFLNTTIAVAGSVKTTGTPAMRADLTELSLTELLSRLRTRALSPAEAAGAYLERIGRLDDELHAYITIAADSARSRAQDLAARDPRGSLLFGAPIAHKDLFETAGIRTTGGSRLFERYVPGRDATLVARLAAAGAITLGKTNTHELGGGVTTINPFFGTTRNPRDPSRIAGGSSGGSAAAVVARLAVAATGTDTGGSVRIPAALCGCVGFKPTFGVLSTAGILGAAPTFDHAGFLTRTVEDLVPLLAAGSGVDPRDPASVPLAASGDVAAVPIRGLRIGVARRFFFDDLDAQVGAAMENALSRLARAGATVRDVQVPLDGTTMARVFDPIVDAEIRQTYDRDWRERPEMFSGSFAELFKAPIPSGLELAAAHRERRAFQVDITERFDQVDVLVMPTVPVVAPRIDGPIDGALILRNTWPFNAAHLPALTLPCGSADALPVGLQLAGPPFGDRSLIAIGTSIERALS
jgi:aspartyl-tRNA(Asn)/glutamyl-tRNA(Gln) amidotransferase subunit A